MHRQATEIKLFRGAVGTSAIGQEDQWSAFSWSLEPPTQSQINLQGVFLLLLPIFSTNMKKKNLLSQEGALYIENFLEKVALASGCL